MEPNEHADTGARIRAAREERHLTQRALAAEIGITPSAMSQFESGKTALSAARLWQLAQTLQLSIGDLYGEGDGKAGGAARTPIRAASASEALTGPLDWRVFEDLPLDPVLKAAAGAFVDIGYHGASVREIAQRAGLSVPALYHHHPSKQDMLVAILETTMKDLLPRAEAARSEGATPTGRFARLIECLALEHTYRRDLAFIGASEMRSLEPANRRLIAGMRIELERMVEAEVDAGVECGEFHTDYPHDLARAVVTMCTSIVGWYKSGGPLTPEEVALRYIDFGLTLVGAPRQGQSTSSTAPELTVLADDSNDAIGPEHPSQVSSAITPRAVFVDQDALRARRIS